MEALLEHLVSAGPQLGSALCYVLICALLIAGGMGLPVPEDIPLLAAGVLCHHGLMDLRTTLVLTLLFVLGADMLLFFMGRRYGRQVPRLPLLRQFVTETRLARADRYFQDHGGKTLLIARFLPGIRSAVWFTAGACRIPWWKMAVCDGTAALVSVPTLVLLGYFGSQHIGKITEWTRVGQIGLLTLMVVVVVAIVAYRLLRRRRKVAAAG